MIVSKLSLENAKMIRTFSTSMQSLAGSVDTRRQKTKNKSVLFVKLQKWSSLDSAVTFSRSMRYNFAQFGYGVVYSVMRVLLQGLSISVVVGAATTMWKTPGKSITVKQETHQEMR